MYGMLTTIKCINDIKQESADRHASWSEVERVQKYSTQVKVPLHYWHFT